MRDRSFSPYTVYILFFFNDTATTEIYTLSLHDALPIWSARRCRPFRRARRRMPQPGSASSYRPPVDWNNDVGRSEEHTSELQSHSDLVCRLLLEKKKA